MVRRNHWSEVTIRFPRNHWYVGAFRAEVGRSPLARTLLGLPVVLYRTVADRVAAVAGSCPHRGYPMSRGTLVDGGIRCGYHGLTFADGSGLCQSPAVAEAGSAPVQLRQFPVREAGPFVWVWLGDPELAGAAAVPGGEDLGFGAAAWRADPTGYLYVRARYRMLCDNLLDTTHIDFVHAGSLGRAPLLFEQTRGPSPERIGVTRESRANPAALFADLFPGGDGPVDVTIGSEFCGPGFIVAVRTEFAQTAPGRASAPFATMTFVHAITPETARSTHYFPAFARDFRLDDERFSAEMNARNLVVASEDKAAVESIEAVAGAGDHGAGFSLPGDAVALLAGDAIAHLVDRER